MKKTVLSLVSIAALSSSLFGYTFNIQDGIQEVDAVVAVEDLSAFNSSCVDFLIARDSQSGDFELYIANGEDYQFNGSVLDSLDEGSSFIVRATGSCSVTVPGMITHNGLVYGSVISPNTGREWLDRNIGAIEACAAHKDTSNANCRGAYYQFGRNTDGHESPTSPTTTTKKTSIYNNNNYFVKDSSDWTTVDDGGALRSAEWSKTDGMSVCPVGFRVPTGAEFEAEKDMYNNWQVDFLKVSLSGDRNWSTADMQSIGYVGNLWSTTKHGYNNKDHLYVNGSNTSTNSANPARGYSVRCIKD